MKELVTEIRFYYADSKSWETKDSDWLQGGMMNVITGKILNLVQCHQVKIDKLDRWMAQRVWNEKRPL